MNGSLAIAKRELKTFFNSLIAYIVLGGFLVLSGWLFFPPLFVAGQASLRSFFAIVPWCFVVLVPAVTMRAIAEEKKSGTMELLLTMPMEDWQIVAGKFIAALGMVAVALAWTLPYPIAVASLAASYPEREVQSWPQQVKEAEALAADPQAQAPLLAAIAEARSLPLAELASRVLGKMNAYAAASGALIGRRQAAEDLIDLASSAEDVAFIAW